MIQGHGCPREPRECGLRTHWGGPEDNPPEHGRAKEAREKGQDII